MTGFPDRKKKSYHDVRNCSNYDFEEKNDGNRRKTDGNRSKNWKMGIFEANFSNFEVYRKSVAPKKSYPATHIIIMKVFKRNHNGNRQLLNGKRSKNCFFEYIFQNLGVTESPDRKKKLPWCPELSKLWFWKKKRRKSQKNRRKSVRKLFFQEIGMISVQPIFMKKQFSDWFSSVFLRFSSFFFRYHSLNYSGHHGNFFFRSGISVTPQFRKIHPKISFFDNLGFSICQLCYIVAWK